MREPTTWTSVSQLVKTALAAVVAWLLSVEVFRVAQPFLAPWAALLTVHATIFGTVRRGATQAVATVLGVLFAFGAGHLFGLNAVSLGVAVLLGLSACWLRGLRVEATTAAATAIMVLTTGYSDNGAMLGARLLDTGMGIAVGLLVNLMVWPPLRDRSAAAQINLAAERFGSLLTRIAAELDGGGVEGGPEDWIATEGLDSDIDQAWAILQQARESGRLNPRSVVAKRMRAAETRSLTRTIGLARHPPDQWPDVFRDRWRELVQGAGAGVLAGEPDAVRDVRARLERLASELRLDELAEGFWPTGGALIVNLRNILQDLDAVADARPVRIPSRGAPSPGAQPRRLPA